MKKLISLLLVSLILCASFGSLSVFAAKSYGWVLGPDAQYLTYDGYTYYPVYSQNYIYNSYYNYSTGYINDSEVDLDYADEETARKFEGSIVTVADYAELYCVSVYLSLDDDYYGENLEVVYVREDYVDEYRNLINGEAYKYSIEVSSKYSNFEISRHQMDEWLGGEKITIPATSVYKYIHVSLEGYNSTDRLRVNCGSVLYDKDAGEVYLLINSELDLNKVYSVNDEMTIYKLEDKVLKESIIDYMNYVPEDDLEWMNPGFSEESDNTALFVLAGVFFGFIPFAVLALSVVMFFVTKTKSYRRGFVLMGIGSILILLAFVLMLLILL